MKESLYRVALRDSWRLVWEHKVLWLFGFFAAFLGQMGLLEMFSKIGLVGTDYAFSPTRLLLPEFVGPLGHLTQLGLSPEGFGWLLWVFSVIGASFLFIILAASASQGALVHSAGQAFKGRKKTLDTEAAWHAGTSHLWRIFFINLIRKIVIFFLAIAMASATITVLVDAHGGDFFLFISLFVLSVVVGVVLSLLAVYAVGYVVVEEYKLFDAIAAGWRLFVSHWLVSIEVGLLLLFINLVIGSLVLVSFFLILVPTMLLWVYTVSVVSKGLALFAVAIALALFLFFVVIVGAVFSAFTTTVWTHLFMKMHKHGIKSRILHWGGFHS